jgi:uncharacterized membrane protein
MTLQTATHQRTTTWDAPRLIGVLLSLVGMADAGYLSWLHLNDTIAAGCSTGSGCDIVQHSVYSEIAGVPIALLGLAGFAAILLALLLDGMLDDWGRLATLGVSLIGVLYSAYLTYVELFVLRAICPYCVASALFMIGLLWVAVTRARPILLEPQD